MMRQKKKGGMTNREIAETLDISVIWVKKLWARYRNVRPSGITYPRPVGRPAKGTPGRR